MVVNQEIKYNKYNQCNQFLIAVFLVTSAKRYRNHRKVSVSRDFDYYFQNPLRKKRNF